MYWLLKKEPRFFLLNFFYTLLINFYQNEILIFLGRWGDEQGFLYRNMGRSIWYLFSFLNSPEPFDRRFSRPFGFGHFSRTVHPENFVVFVAKVFPPNPLGWVEGMTRGSFSLRYNYTVHHPSVCSHHSVLGKFWSPQEKVWGGLIYSIFL